MEVKHVRRLATGIVVLLLSFLYIFMSQPGRRKTPEPFFQSFPAANHLHKNITPFINYTLRCGAHINNKPCVFLIDKKNSYVLGERIRVGIVLSYGHSKVEQEDKSDILLVFARNKTKAAGSTAKVIYQGHGKYIAIVQALWVGRSTIHVIIRATGSAVEKINQTLSHRSIGRDYFCYFQYSNSTETTRADFVLNESTMDRNKYCDLTVENYGYFLYCLKPQTRELQCTDWTKVTSKQENSSHLMTDIQSGAVMVRLEVNLTVGITSRNAEKLLMPSVVCERKHFKETWSIHSPKGYFYNNTWQSTHCRGVTSGSSNRFKKCLRNRTIRLFGDSTVRQLFRTLTETLQANFLTENPKNRGAMHRPMRAVSTELNTTLYWGLHSIPIAYKSMYRGVTRPIHVHLDLIPANSNDIILFGIFVHFVRQNQNIFRERMQRIAKSVTSLLNRAPNVKIAIKGPLSILDTKKSYSNFCGIVGYLFRQIIFEEFQHLRDQVIFLDYMDLTIAIENTVIHPNSVVVKAFVDHFLLYACTS